MTDRMYRFVAGIILLTILFFEWKAALYVYIGVLGFEGTTNWRVPLLASRITNGGATLDPARPTSRDCRIPFDLERAFRLVLTMLLLLSIIVLPDILWFFPWFIGLALSMAAITGVCPMAILLKKAGFRT
jgi:hypothetical protein